MASSQASHDDNSKYVHLLQPIRDLAANWDVNIADELEDYLVRWRFTSIPPPRGGAENCPGVELAVLLQEVLESVKFSFEDGPSLNFAEGERPAPSAALVGCPKQMCPSV